MKKIIGITLIIATWIYLAIFGTLTTPVSDVNINSIVLENTTLTISGESLLEGREYSGFEYSTDKQGNLFLKFNFKRSSSGSDEFNEVINSESLSKVKKVYVRGKKYEDVQEIQFDNLNK